ncbi:hypothetical protein MACK_003711 [Theileria orientalis]|uniref:Uncharacterized protein n=1 Tax=Theileria orientalis TaxID=68886 RepID=A0A976XJ28_THEOR|nr:hypothetical protein MACK_003711 [Theileria orientalis]
MEHEENCPWLTSEQNTTLIHTLPKNCQNRKCSVWKDLKGWFGYLGNSLSLLAFQEIYRDVAHDGSGVYERMALEGGKILKEVVELQSLRGGKEDLYLNGVARLVFGTASESYFKFVKKLHLRKMSELVNDTDALHKFARLYLAGAQTLTTPRSVANYVRVSVAFSVNEVAGPSHHSPTAEWIVPLIQHIYHCQKFKHLQFSCDNLLVTNLHRYMGYKYEDVLPRIKECFTNLQSTPQGTEVHGFVLLSSFAHDYFLELHKLYYGNEWEAEDFAKAEVLKFLNSRAVELFACVYMKLHLTYLNENLNVVNQRPLREAKTIFINLLGACWSISQKESRNVWLANIFQTLRQIQLSLVSYTSGTKTLTQAHLSLPEFKSTNMVKDKFDLLLNTRTQKLKGSGGEMSPYENLYEPFSSAVKDESPGKETLAKLSGGLLEAYGYVQDFLYENAYKVIQNSCFDAPDDETVDTKSESLGPGDVLPVNVKYEEEAEMAHIKIPLGKIAAAKNVNYRTLLKNKHKNLMELSINNFNQEFPSFCVKVPTKK